jgi:hypothetical protein
MSFVRLTPPTVFKWEPLLLLNLSMDIEDGHVPKILIFINIWLLELSHFREMRVHILYRVHLLSGYLLPQFSSVDLLVLQNIAID